MARLAFPRHIPFVETLGFELWAFGDGLSELQFDPAPGHMNSYLVAHGGALMTLLDVTMAHAARSVGAHIDADGRIVSDDSRGVVTIEMKTSFMRAAEGRLTARGKLLHKTTTLAFTEGSVFNAAGELCAQATGTFKYIRALPTAGRELKPFAEPTSKGSA